MASSDLDIFSFYLFFLCWKTMYYAQYLCIFLKFYILMWMIHVTSGLITCFYRLFHSLQCFFVISFHHILSTILRFYHQCTSQCINTCAAMNIMTDVLCISYLYFACTCTVFKNLSKKRSCISYFFLILFSYFSKVKRCMY